MTFVPVFLSFAFSFVPEVEGMTPGRRNEPIHRTPCEKLVVYSILGASKFPPAAGSMGALCIGAPGAGDVPRLFGETCLQ